MRGRPISPGSVWRIGDVVRITHGKLRGNLAEVRGGDYRGCLRVVVQLDNARVVTGVHARDVKRVSVIEALGMLVHQLD